MTIVTTGDSLSDKRHWSNQKVLWSELLAERIHSTCGSNRLVEAAQQVHYR